MSNQFKFKLNSFLIVLKSPVYWFSNAFIIILSYSFDLFNRTVGIDDLARLHYIGEESAMIKATRWGMFLWNRLLSNAEYAPFVDKFFGIIFLAASAVIFSFILFSYIEDSKYRILICSVFSCLYVSYPLINEIWNYNGANMVICGNAVLVGISIIILKYGSSKTRSIIITSLMLTPVVSSYEASAFLYITVVLSVLLFDLIVYNKKDWFRTGLNYAAPLVLAVALRYIIGYALIALLKYNYSVNGDTVLHWHNRFSIHSQIKLLIENNFGKYVIRGLVYFPITIFDLALLLFTICIFGVYISKKDLRIILLYVFLLTSLFAQAILQNVSLPYRTAQPIQFFTALGFTVFLCAIKNYRQIKLFFISFVLICYICLRQGVFLNRILALNNQRSENEIAIVHNIGYELKSNYDDKPVVFAGSINLGSFIEKQICVDESTIGGRIYTLIAKDFGFYSEHREVIDTDINSLINWNTLAFSSQKMMAELFSYNGYDIKVKDTMTREEIKEFYKIAIDKNLRELEICDMGDYILVFLGETTY